MNDGMQLKVAILRDAAARLKTTMMCLFIGSYVTNYFLSLKAAGPRSCNPAKAGLPALL